LADEQRSEIQDAVIRHAMSDLAAQPGVAQGEPRSLIGRFVDWVRHNKAQQPKFGAQVKAMLREAAKDINATLHQVFFSQQPGASEPGTPLVPTQQQVTKALGNVYGKSEDYPKVLAEAAARGAQQGRQRGMER
jgi:hypothetical protein